MTVCVAAIADYSFIIGASDRMLTAGDVEFEPETAKLWRFSPSIFALVAGDMATQAEILKEVNKETQTWILADTKKWMRVKDVASLYCKKYRELRRDKAEAAILYPLGLTLQSFLGQQSSMHPEQVEKIANQLIEYELPSIEEAIFIGIDHDGPLGPTGEEQIYTQLYTTERDKLSYLSSVGFAAIGYGKAHAESQLMFYGHNPKRSFDDTLILTYAAKKRAEVAPGVGKATDMIVIGAGVGVSYMIEPHHIADIDDIYQKNRKVTERGIARAQRETAKFTARVRKDNDDKKAAEAKKDQPKPSDSQTSADRQ